MNKKDLKTDSRGEEVSDSCKVACFDLQATLPTPKGEVSSFYYKSKLSTYNFTVCDLLPKGQGDVQCFMWHEGEGKRGAVEIGSCLLQYLNNKDELCSGELNIVFYSDNCGAQQKNKFVLATYLYAVINYKIRSISHKYLITGHTQNEGDNVHSLIEKNIKRYLMSGPIYTPDQYVTLVKTSKKTGHPFKVTEMSHKNFLDIKEMTDKTCVNFTKNTDGETFKFNDVAMFKIESQHPDQFFYKMSFEEQDFKAVNVKEHRTRTASLADLKDYKIKKAYTDSLPIPKKKYDDFMFLLRSNAIKSNYSHFYNALKVAPGKQ